MIIDHAVPAPRPSNDANCARRARAFVARFWPRASLRRRRPRHLPPGDRRESGSPAPVSCSSARIRTRTAAGAFNCAGRGVGTLEMLAVACTGSTWFVVAPTIKVSSRPDGWQRTARGRTCSWRWRSASAPRPGEPRKFEGGGIAGLSLHDRRTIATQCVEIDAEFVLFPCDEVVRDHLRRAASRPRAGVKPQMPEAAFAARWSSTPRQAVQPLRCARPGGCRRSRRGGQPRSARCGSISASSAPAPTGNWRTSRFVASLLAGRRIARGTRLISHPRVAARLSRGGPPRLPGADRRGRRRAVTNSTCGACFGHHMGVLWRRREVPDLLHPQLHRPHGQSRARRSGSAPRAPCSARHSAGRICRPSYAGWAR